MTATDSLADLEFDEREPCESELHADRGEAPPPAAHLWLHHLGPDHIMAVCQGCHEAFVAISQQPNRLVECHYCHKATATYARRYLGAL